MARLPFLALLAAALVAAGCGASKDTASAASAASADLASSGFSLPAMTLERLDGSGTVNTGDYTGTPTVLNVWATWCPYCVEEMPAIEAVHQELGDHVRFVGVDRADELAKARELAERTGVTYELLVDPDSRLFAAIAARAMPTTVFVDTDGRVVHRHAGPLDRAGLRRLISEHLGL